MDEPVISGADGEGRGARGGVAAGMPVWGLVFLALTVAVSVAALHFRLLDGDDFLQVWSDRVSSLAQVVHIQRATPMVIDPLFYHGLIYLVIRVFGESAFFLRLPSLVGFVVMMVCLFYFVRRIAPARAAVLALALPMISGGFGYVLQVRPYGVLLGLFGLAMLSWQTAARREGRRGVALVVLALSIAAAINSQYYGVLLMLPLCLGEAVRVWERRRLDVPVVLALGAGLAGMVGLIPFMKGAADFRAHYKAGNVPYQAITQTYNFLILGESTFTQHINHVLALVLGVGMVVVLWSVVRQWRKGTLRLPDAELVFLLTLAALPVFAFLLGHFVTHAMESRYAIGAILGMSALVAIALVPVMKHRAAGFAVLAVVAVVFTWSGVREIGQLRVSRERTLAALVVPPEVMQAVMASPSQTLYTQDIDLVGRLAFHDPGAEILRHMVLVDSVNEEMRWNQSQTDSKIVANLGTIAGYKVVPYERVMEAPGEHVFVVTHGGWNWLDKAFASGEVQVVPVGQALGGDVVAVRAGQR